MFLGLGKSAFYDEISLRGVRERVLSMSSEQDRRERLALALRTHNANMGRMHLILSRWYTDASTQQPTLVDPVLGRLSVLLAALEGVQ